MSVEQTGREDCFFCGSEGPIQTHHIVPSRYGGGQRDGNLVDLCPTCHRRLEQLYDEGFYESVGVLSGRGDVTRLEIYEFVKDQGQTPRRELYHAVADRFDMDPSEASSEILELCILGALDHHPSEGVTAPTAGGLLTGPE